MTKYCMFCKMPKSKHEIYVVQGITYMCCEESKCADECPGFLSKRELLELPADNFTIVQEKKDE